MQSQCPYPDCNLIFELTEQVFVSLPCPSCGRMITARSLERALAIDKVKQEHARKGTLAGQENLFQYEPMPKFVAVLEEIRSLWNVGSIFRTADGCGFKQLYLLGITGYPPRKEISKTSLGAEDHVGWRYAAASTELLPLLKQAGYQIVALEKCEATGTDLRGAISSKLLQTPLCLVVGNEVTGLYRETIELADLVVDLPMVGFKTSLNVAVAFGIAAYMIAESFQDGQPRKPS